MIKSISDNEIQKNYSFRTKSAASQRSNIANSGNKNMADSENDFIQQNNVGMGNSRIITWSNIVTSNRITADFGGQSQVQTSTPSQMARARRDLREPGDSKKKMKKKKKKKKI